MGLDTFAATRGEDGKWAPAPDEPFERISLCGGMYSGGSDSSSIRGKVYDELVEEATGESLYQRLIQPARVPELTRRLRAAVEQGKRAGTRTREEMLRTLDERGRVRHDEEGNTRLKTFGALGPRRRRGRGRPR